MVFSRCHEKVIGLLGKQKRATEIVARLIYPETSRSCDGVAFDRHVHDSFSLGAGTCYVDCFVFAFSAFISAISVPCFYDDAGKGFCHIVTSRCAGGIVSAQIHASGEIFRNRFQRSASKRTETIFHVLDHADRFLVERSPFALPVARREKGKSPDANNRDDGGCDENFDNGKTFAKCEFPAQFSAPRSLY